MFNHNFMFYPRLKLGMQKKIIFTLVCILSNEIITASLYGRTRKRSIYWYRNESYSGNKLLNLAKAALVNRTRTESANSKIGGSKLRVGESGFTKLSDESFEYDASKYNMDPSIQETTKDPFERATKLNGYDIKNHMEKIFQKFTSVKINISSLARTDEYNDIVLVKISDKLNSKTRFRATDNKYEENVEKKIVFIVHNLVVMGSDDLPCLSEEIEFSYLVSVYLKYIAYFDILLIPIANPDGFNYVNQPLVKRMLMKQNIWNKNRSPQEECAGVAVDRNFLIAFPDHNISSCSQLFPGRKAFSEIESRTIAKVFHLYIHKIVAYFNVHAGSYKNNVVKGDAVLHPKGYAASPSNEDKYLDLKGEIDEALNNASIKILTVTVDTLQHWYGDVYGTSVDYASSVYGVPYALEFVMQTYATDEIKQDYPERNDHASLTAVWETVIRVVFDFIKTTRENP